MFNMVKLNARNMALVHELIAANGGSPFIRRSELLRLHQELRGRKCNPLLHHQEHPVQVVSEGEAHSSARHFDASAVPGPRETISLGPSTWKKGNGAEAGRKIPPGSQTGGNSGGQSPRREEVVPGRQDPRPVSGLGSDQLAYHKHTLKNLLTSFFLRDIIVP